MGGRGHRGRGSLPLELCPLGTMVPPGLVRPPGSLSAWSLSLPLSPLRFHSATWESSAHSSRSTAHAPQGPQACLCPPMPQIRVPGAHQPVCWPPGGPEVVPKVGGTCCRPELRTRGAGAGRGAGLGWAPGTTPGPGRQLMSSLRCSAGPASPASHGARRLCPAAFKEAAPCPHLGQGSGV